MEYVIRIMFVKFTTFLRGTRGPYHDGWLQVRKPRILDNLTHVIVGTPSTLNAILYFIDIRRRGRPVSFSRLSSLRSPQCRFQWQASICRNYYVYHPHSLKPAHPSGSSVFIVSCGSTGKANIIRDSRRPSPLVYDLRHRHRLFFPFV